MVIFGGSWGGRPRYGRGYGFPRGYGYPRYGGGNSCLRDILFLETGCCLANALGCWPELMLLGPSLTRSSIRVARTYEPSADSGWAERVRHGVMAAIERYQREISPRRAQPCCRYSPSCSRYALDALERHGLRRGLELTVRRLLRCRPGAPGGEDPVPD